MTGQGGLSETVKTFTTVADEWRRIVFLFFFNDLSGFGRLMA